MNQTVSEVPAEARKSLGKMKWIVGLILLLVAGAAAMNLPRGYSDDLSRIGKGQAVIVLVHNKNSPESIELMHVLDNVRGGYAGKIEFLLAEPTTPQGRTFMASNHASQVSLVMFDATGKSVKMLYAPQTPENIRQAIATSLGVQP